MPRKRRQAIPSPGHGFSELAVHSLPLPVRHLFHGERTMTAPRIASAGKPGNRNRKSLEKPTPPREVTITVPERTVRVERSE